MKKLGTCTVGDLEEALLARYPRAWAEPWDRVGLSVGDSAQVVARVAVSLDATPDAIAAADAVGANVLVTHHPVCLDMPQRIGPASPATELAAGAIWEAVRRGVALVAFHTNLDRSPDATGRLPRMLGLDPVCGIEAGRDPARGRLGSYADLGAGITLDALACRCGEVFGGVAQVFGDGAAAVGRAAFFTGSIGSGVGDALAVGADVAVCGECGYHRALELVGRGCAVIILGHDVSERPLADVLAERLVQAGLPADAIVRLADAPAWHGVG